VAVAVAGAIIAVVIGGTYWLGGVHMASRSAAPATSVESPSQASSINVQGAGNDIEHNEKVISASPPPSQKVGVPPSDKMKWKWCSAQAGDRSGDERKAVHADLSEQL
jgi:hypothetical protein